MSELSYFDSETATEKLKRHKLPDIGQISAELITSRR
jgi:hypothetical protein